MDNYTVIGKDIPRVDGREKATGAAIYTDDIKLPGMLHGKLLRSPFPHARIRSIDVGKARRLSGVKCVITGEDTPKIKYGNWRLFPATQDEYPLALYLEILEDPGGELTIEDVSSPEYADRFFTSQVVLKPLAMLRHVVYYQVEHQAIILT